jgi:hypothetical protein
MAPIALLPLALSLAPELARLAFGDRGAATAAAAADAVRIATGTEDAAAARAALDGDPAAASGLRLELARIAAEADAEVRRAELEELRAQLADVANARSTTVELARSGSPIAWGAPVVSLLVLATFWFTMWIAMTQPLPQGSETILTMVLGTLSGMATAVVAYWVGSSAGSARKDEMLRNIGTPPKMPGA